MSLDKSILNELSNPVLRLDYGEYVPVSFRGMSDLLTRCDTSKLDLLDMRTWGTVNWYSYTMHGGELWVLRGSYEAQITGMHP